MEKSYYKMVVTEAQTQICLNYLLKVIEHCTAQWVYINIIMYVKNI